MLLRDDGGARRFEVLLVTAHPLAAAPEAVAVASPRLGRALGARSRRARRRPVRAAWARGDRVEALQLVADEVAAMAATDQDFVSAVRTLDTFGALVLARLREKAADPRATPTARDTHGNWMSRVHALRLLAPRFYVESALLRCCEFGDEAVDAVARGSAGPRAASATRAGRLRAVLPLRSAAAGADRGVLAALAATRRRRAGATARRRRQAETHRGVRTGAGASFCYVSYTR